VVVALRGVTMDDELGPPRGYYGTVASRGLGRMAMEELTLRLQPDAIEFTQVALDPRHAACSAPQRDVASSSFCVGPSPQGFRFPAAFLSGAAPPHKP
jgi:hypothetical protein